MCSQKLKILLIDNDEDDYVLIRALLGDAKGCEFELEWVSTYDKGIEIIKRQLHEVYLIDYRLGEHNGLELLCAANETGCRKPIILLIGKGNYEIDVEAMRLGAADYLEKEWIEGHLLERSIRYAMYRKQAVEDLRRARCGLEEKWDERAAELQSGHDELEHLTYMTAHDIQEPLRSIEGAVRLLMEDHKEKLTGEAEGLLERARDGVSVIQRLSHRLQTFAGVRRQGKPFEPVDCSAVLKQVIDDLEGLKKEEKVEITCDVMPQIFADSDQIGQVFLNLLTNAIKRCQKQPPQIHIGAEVNGATWVFSVRDNGPSVDVRTAEQLFLLSSPLHAQMGFVSTGIGLALCKNIVARHGGRIWVEDVTGEGVKFCFSIPAQKK